MHYPVILKKGNIVQSNRKYAFTNQVHVEPEMVNASYRVKSFDFNSIKIYYKLPDGVNRSWLYYCDNFSKYWSATVNNKPIEVYQANLAYKAVYLSQPEGIVTFRFNIPYFKMIHYFLSILACIVFITTIYLGIRVTLRR